MELERDGLDLALHHTKMEHRWIESARYERGRLDATVRIGSWPLTTDVPPSVGFAQAGPVVDQLVRVAVQAALNAGDERLGRELRKGSAAQWDKRARAYLDLRFSIELGDDLPLTVPIPASVRLKHTKSSGDRVFIAFNGTLGPRVRFRGDCAVGGAAVAS